MEASASISLVVIAAIVCPALLGRLARQVDLYKQISEIDEMTNFIKKINRMSFKQNSLLIN